MSCHEKEKKLCHEKENKLVELKVRMYRPGLGDCFLLTFKNDEGNLYRMLIDFGILMPTTGGADRMRSIAEDILSTTGSHIDTLVATHEHWDHISGFRYARKILGLHPDETPEQPLQVDRVWLAWTENLEDPQVKEIIAPNLEARSLAINAAMVGMGVERSKRVQELLRFDGPDEEPDELLGARKKSGGTWLRQIMDDLRSGWGTPEYLEPSSESQPAKSVKEIPEFGIKIYVLGPSRKMRQLGGEQDPSSETTHGLRLNQMTAFMAAAFNQIEDTQTALADMRISQSDINQLSRLSQPFDRSRAITIEELEKACQEEDTGKEISIEVQSFYKEHYGLSKDKDSKDDWRRIDYDWLRISESLALQYVSHVNNTSLVLAIELTESGKVLLFPGDAEFESWETWENREVKDLQDLFRRTVLYKVGHHGSINATLIEGGLDKMTNVDELTAMIPVDKVRAHRNEWNFPAPSLYEELEKRTQGRIILNCEDSECPTCEPSYDMDKFDEKDVTIIEDESSDKLWLDYILKL